MISIFVFQYFLYNYARFGSPFDTGYSYLPLEGLLKERFLEGMFSVNHFWFNLKIFLFQLPEFTSKFPFLKFDPIGLSIIVSSSFLLFIIKSDIRKNLPLFFASSLVFLPQLFYYNTGWWQFGYRFILDVLPFLMLMLGSLTFTRKESRILIFLILVSIYVNYAGLFLNRVWYMGA